jgi:hypothetical protein
VPGGQIPARSHVQGILHLCTTNILTHRLHPHCTLQDPSLKSIDYSRVPIAIARRSVGTAQLDQKPSLEGWP